MENRAEQLTIGVLAMQGAVREHIRAIERCSAVALPVKQARELELIDGLIIPGGESTTIGKLMEAFDFVEPLKRRALEGMAVFGTCAGLILLAKTVLGGEKPPLGLIDIKVRRNAFGRQVESFETDIHVDGFGPERLRAVFIRAPLIEEAGEGVKVLATHAGRPVMVERGRFLACAFHPELTDDLRVHKYFCDMVKKAVYPGVSKEVDICPAIRNGQR